MRTVQLLYWSVVTISKPGGAVTWIAIPAPWIVFRGLNVKVTGFANFVAPVMAVDRAVVTVKREVLVKVHKGKPVNGSELSPLTSRVHSFCDGLYCGLFRTEMRKG